jgi:apolipoprotein N-acyltransferase
VYTKRRLVPFGEYVPLEGLLRGLIGFFDLPMSHTEPGAPVQPLLRVGEAKIAMAICYEVVYPDLVREQARDANLLATVSNDTWFGASIGPLQHLQMARMRALELGRFMLRATNNGVTAVIDARGRVVAQLPQFAPGVLRGQVWLMAGDTPYARFGDVPVLALLAGLLAAGWRGRRRSEQGAQA